MAENNDTKQEDNKEVNNNPTGKGGFGDNPQNINIKGRPKEGASWKDILALIGDTVDPSDPDGTRTYKLAVGQILWDKCMEGDSNAMKILLNRMEGKPRIQLDVKGSIDTGSDKVAELLQLMYEQANSDSKEDSGNVLPE